MKNADKKSVFAVVGAATGLGNVFRFPALCATYGGAFVLAYAIVLIIVCYPLMCAELGSYKIIKGVKGRRIWAAIMRAATVNSLLIALYYAVICAELGANSLCFVCGANNAQPFTYAFVIAVAVAAGYILKAGKGALTVSGKASVCLSSAMLAALAACGLLKTGGRYSFNFYALKSGAVWVDALGQALLSLSLAAGVMPNFARQEEKGVPIRRTALKIICANFVGCVLAWLAVMPYFDAFPQTGGVNAGIAVYNAVISSLFSGVWRRVLGAALFAVLSLVAVHSLCSLAYPAVSLFKTKRAPFIFSALCIVLFPLFYLSGGAILSACDYAACSVTAVIIAFCECLIMSWKGHIKGAIGFFVRFVCPLMCGTLAVCSLLSSKIAGFSPLAAACAYAYLAVAAIAPIAPKLKKFALSRLTK